MAIYHATRTTIGDYTFASKTESQRYLYLRSCEEAGEIENLIADKKQLRFDLAPSIRLPVTLARPARRKVSRVYYEADFRYTIWIKSFPFHIWEDVKGLSKGKPFVDPKSTVKMNLFRALNGNDKSVVLRICTKVTADPLDVDDYFY